MLNTKILSRTDAKFSISISSLSFETKNHLEGMELVFTKAVQKHQLIVLLEPNAKKKFLILEHFFVSLATTSLSYFRCSNRKDKLWGEIHQP